MILIVGLGNPGTDYEKTYHNIGFMVLDEFCKKQDIKLSRHKDKAVIFEGRIFDEKVVIAKPQTFVNNSGEAVQLLAKRFKPDKILIIYDDIDIEIGKFRYRKEGSAGTHNGMRSVLSLMGTEKINKLRIGTSPTKAIDDLADYVLSRINSVDYEKICDAIDDATDFLEQYIKGTV